MALPTVVSVTPATGTYAGDTPVLIIGTNFTGATAVQFDGEDANDFTVIDATNIVASSCAHDAGAVTVTVTNATGESTDEISFTYTGSAGLFTVAEARAFDKAQLVSASLYTSDEITAKEVAIRAKFERIIGVDLTVTTHTEYYDGEGTNTLYLNHHMPYAAETPSPVTLTSVTVIATDDTETAYTATELSNIVKYPHKLVRRSGWFAAGHRNIKVVFSTGYTTAPDDIKTAALWACVQELVPSSAPSAVIDGSEGYGGATINWSRVKDPGRGRWYGNESIDSVLREHRMIEMGSVQVG